MNWDGFIWFAIPAVALWAAAGVLVYTRKGRRTAEVLMLTGIGVFAAFIALLWAGLGRPPLRTMGETRLWYSLFLSAVGFITYKRWGYKWLLSFSGLMAVMFVLVNLLKLEIHTRHLMPALRSVWFVPHVTVYMLSYAMLGAATIASVLQLRRLNRGAPDGKLYDLTDNLIYAGFGFLMLGMLMGCLWAKTAWGHFWTWDPKETWAFVTAAAYLTYIHMRLRRNYPKLTAWVLPVAFVLLMVTWIGVNYLPSARGSVHVY
ncbi:MAG: cytochrome c biogenesis protein CcsA [Rikenellaceae bacterium]|nr:cytochrome c biogenesis protein CcsA [Rikenellaceae bacterium]